LAQVLRRVNNSPITRHDDLLVGIGGSDDAGVYRITDDIALVQTVDFFTPIVDEAYDWGRIAAANALSDVYAMGGAPLTALQLVGWPRDKLPFELLGDVLEGGASALEEAHCTLVGGHSIDDTEPKYGLAVTGVVHPDDIVGNDGAKPGQMILLTKPIGTGLIATGIKRGVVSRETRDAAVATMSQLNAAPSRAMRRVRVSAATDVTGFGLLGHLGEMVRGSGVSAEIEFDAVPLLPEALSLAEQNVVPGGSLRNLEAVSRTTRFGELDRPRQILLADAQTNGGLLLTIDAPLANALLQAVEDEGAMATIIGRITERDFSDGPAGVIRVV
jgi:selenide,water dikinase